MVRKVMTLREKAIEFIYKIATGSRRIRTLLTPMGAAFFLFIVTLIIVASLQVDRFLGFPKFLPALWNVILSVPVIIIGLSLMLWSVLYFIKARGTPVPFNPPSMLVTTGPYAYTRNPMVLGVFVLLFGIGILLRSISLVFIFLPLFILLGVLELKKIEEPELEKRLGQAYLEYKKRVPMFIPCRRGHG